MAVLRGRVAEHTPAALLAMVRSATQNPRKLAELASAGKAHELVMALAVGMPPPARTRSGSFMRTGTPAPGIGAPAVPEVVAAERRMLTPRTGKMILAWVMKYPYPRRRPRAVGAARGPCR